MINTDAVRKVELKQRTKLKELIEDTEYVVAFSINDCDRTDGFIMSYDNDKRYTIETKWYGDIKNLRYSDKFKDYMIDYDKLKNLTELSKTHNSKPFLICFFSNELVVWDLNKTNWDSTGEWRWVNKEGLNYGKEKEYSFMAFLKLEDAIYRNKNITPFN